MINCNWGVGGVASFPFCFGNFLCGMSGVALNCVAGAAGGALCDVGHPAAAASADGIGLP